MTSEARKLANRESQRRYRKRHAEAIKVSEALDLRIGQARELLKAERNRKDKPCVISVSCSRNLAPQSLPTGS
jgi:hypothetical protein